MSVYIARFCVENIVDVSELTEVIEDLMDEEFDTVCHDNSPKGLVNCSVILITLNNPFFFISQALNFTDKC